MFEEGFRESKYRWVILACAWLSFAVSWIPRTMYSPLIPEMSSALHLTYTQAGLLTTGFWAGYFIAQLPSGLISDRIGVKPTLTGALALIEIFSLMIGTASSFTNCLVYRVMSGLAAGCIFAPGSAIVLRWFHPKSRGIGTSLYVTGSNIGAIIGLIVSPLISARYIWRWSFWILSIPMFFASILVYLFLKDPAEAYSSNIVKTKTISYYVIFKKRSMWFLILATVGYFFAFSAITTWAPTYFIGAFGVSALYAGSILSLFSGLGIIGTPLGGIIADKVIKKRALVVFLGYMITSAGCLIMPVLISSGIWSTIILLILIGVFGTMGGGLGVAIVSKWFPFEIRGTALGFFNLGTLGASVSPFMFGAILDVTGSFTLGWIVLGIISVMFSMLMISLITRSQ